MTGIGSDELPSTCAWAEATGGAHDPLQRRRVRRAVAWRSLVVTVGLATRPWRRPLQGAAPTAPDSKLSRGAESAAREPAAALVMQGYSTLILCRALAHRDRRGLDPELFYVVA